MPEKERLEGWVEYGKVGRPHGLRGELRFFPYNPESEVLRRLRHGRLVLNATQQRDVNIASVRGSEDPFIIRFVEIQQREDAAAWTHARLFVDPKIFPEIDEDDTFYHWQLKGLEARSADGTRVGTIRSVQNFGAGDLLEIATPRGDVDVPFMEPWVGEIDLEQGFVIVDPSWLDD